MPSERLVRVGGRTERRRGEERSKDGGGGKDPEKKCQSNGDEARPGPESNDQSS